MVDILDLLFQEKNVCNFCKLFFEDEKHLVLYVQYMTNVD